MPVLAVPDMHPVVEVGGDNDRPPCDDSRGERDQVLGTRPLRGIEDGLPAEREAHGPGQQLTDIVQPQLSLRLLRRAGNREVSDALSEGVPDAVCA